MKILHIIDSGGLYGAEMVLLNLMEEQIKLGLAPTIASIGEKHIKEKPIETEALKRGFKVKKFRMRPGPNYLGAMKILGFGHKAGFDIMHSHGYKGNILFGFIPKSIRKIPLISTIHGWTSTNISFTKMKLYEWLDSKSLKYIDAVVLISNSMKSHPHLRNLDQTNVRVIHNGIPIQEERVDKSTNQRINESTTQQFNQSPALSATPVKQPLDREINEIISARISLDQQTQETQSTQQTLDQSIVDYCLKGYTIGSIGRLSIEKGFKYLVEALALLIKAGISARLIIIGEGSERDYLEKLSAQHKLSDRILLPGYCEDAKKYMQFFNVLVIPSLTEGLPMTLLEAMQAKIPILATEVGGIPEVLGNGVAGLLTKPNSPNNLAKTINRLYHDRKLSSELTSSAYERVVINYSSENMALRYLEIYKCLMN